MRARNLLLALVFLGGLASGGEVARAAGPPQIVATWATDVTASSANLRTEINPNGQPTKYHFEYVSEAAFLESGFANATTAPPMTEAAAGAGTVPLELVQHPSGLLAGTVYRYRVRATNASAMVLGPEHRFRTQEATLTFQLPDDRAWEMVSPADKHGGAIQGREENFGGDLDQAATSTSAFTYSAAPAFADAGGAPPASQYLSVRTAAGWTTQNLSPPLEAGAYGDRPDGVPFRLFAADLSAGVLYGGDPCRGQESCANPSPPLTGSGGPAGYRDYYIRNSATGGFSSLLTAAELTHSSVSPQHFNAQLVGASSDLAHIVISTCAALTADATEVSTGPGECDANEPNLYEWSAGELKLLNCLPGQTTGTPGAKIAAPLGAVSAGGDRVYFASTVDGQLYLYEGGSVQLVSSTGEFQAASDDGSAAFVLRSGHLYRFQATTKTTTDLTPPGGVVGVLGTSADGTYAYYQDLSAVRQWHEGTTTVVAAGFSASTPEDYPPATGSARLSADGAHLAFLSDAQLTDYENVSETEAYVYGPTTAGAPPSLVCASCNPTGERAGGSASIPGAPLNGAAFASYKPRALSADGRRLFFESSDHLLPQDTSSEPDLYEWELPGEGDCQRPSGCLGLISSGRATQAVEFLDASGDGSDVYFLTDRSLVPTDEGSIDVYDARVGGGFDIAQPPLPCEGDACQALPRPPDDPTPGTLLIGPSNPAVHFPKKKQRLRRHLRKRHHKGHGGKHRAHRKGKEGPK